MADYKHSMDKYNLTCSKNLIVTGAYLQIIQHYQSPRHIDVTEVMSAKKNPDFVLTHTEYKSSHFLTQKFTEVT